MVAPGGAARLLEGAGLEAVIIALRDRGYTVIGPTVRDGVISYEPVTSSANFRAESATSRSLRDTGFESETTPRASASQPHPPRGNGISIHRRQPCGARSATSTERSPSRRNSAPPTRYAFLGVRACELAAILVHDRVFVGSAHVDPTYAARRRDLFIVAVHCGSPSGVCFCASMDTGPRAREGFDLGITELLDTESPRYVIEAGTPAGQEVLETLPVRVATEQDRDAAIAVTDAATNHMGRQMDTRGLPEMLQRNLEHPRWDDVAARCLSCGNCTMACPTCFCSDDVESQAPDGESSSRVREWASCFSRDFSYIHGGAVRQPVRSRYRQWMTHKLGTWWEQFETSGCVGCGRCIAWCPVGIDITEEAAAIRATDGLPAMTR